MARWVIVAQLSGNTHTPTVYGTWKTQAAAQAQMQRWETRFERDFASQSGKVLPR